MIKENWYELVGVLFDDLAKHLHEKIGDIDASDGHWIVVTGPHRGQLVLFQYNAPKNVRVYSGSIQ